MSKGGVAKVGGFKAGREGCKFWGVVWGVVGLVVVVLVASLGFLVRSTIYSG